uniref:IF rod domain-containing protein n=1 Tax=Zonotrichia albicollis TaxID=44394 RepID=A0A8D2MBV3_ZONAL
MRKRLCWAEDGNGADDGGGEQGYIRDRNRAKDKDKVTNGHKAGSAPCPTPALHSRGVPRFEAELAIRLSVDSDIAGLRKVLDDTNMTRLQLEGDIEALREELILLRKDHDQVGPEDLGGSGGAVGPQTDPCFLQEVQDLRAQASQSALTVEVDAPQSQDLGKVLGELRAQYDALAQKNLEDLEKQWGQQITETTLEVTQSTKDLDVARGTVGALRRSLQTLEIDLEALRNQVPQNSPNSPRNPP